MKNRDRFTHPPHSLRRAKLDNLALVPGSMLPFLQRCRQVANELPPNGALIVLAKEQPIQRKALLAVAKLLAAEGQQARILPAEEVRGNSVIIIPYLCTQKSTR